MELLPPGPGPVPCSTLPAVGFCLGLLAFAVYELAEYLDTSVQDGLTP